MLLLDSTVFVRGLAAIGFIAALFAGAAMIVWYARRRAESRNEGFDVDSPPPGGFADDLPDAWGDVPPGHSPPPPPAADMWDALAPGGVTASPTGAWHTDSPTPAAPTPSPGGDWDTPEGGDWAAGGGGDWAAAEDDWAAVAFPTQQEDDGGEVWQTDGFLTPGSEPPSTPHDDTPGGYS